MMRRRAKSGLDPAWARLLARLRALAADYEKHVREDRSAHAHVSPFAAMHANLALLVTLADLFQRGRREGWTTLLTFAPPSAEIGRAARVSVSIVEKANQGESS